MTPSINQRQRLWCEEEKVLSSIYGFTHIAASDNQSHPELFHSVFRRFVSALYVAGKKSPSSGDSIVGSTWPTLTHADLSLLKSTAEYLTGSDKNVTWFPDYGCALVALHRSTGGDTIRLSDDIPLILIGLDNWSFHSVAQCGTQHTAACSGSSILHAPPESSEITSKDVLQWVMNNTVDATLKGILEWSKQGLDYAQTRSINDNGHSTSASTTAPTTTPEEQLLVDEVLELSELYGGSRAKQPVGAVVSQFAATKKISENPDQEMMKVIQERSSLYGDGYEVTAVGGLNEEVEQELEVEQEEEEEVESEIARLEAREEIDWRYESVLTATSILDISATVQVRTLVEVAAFLHPARVKKDIDWSKKVYCTTNFLSSADDSAFEKRSFLRVHGVFAINEYLRPVDVFLLLPGDNSVVLLSEREANGVLKAMLESKKQKHCRYTGALLMHLCYACDAASTKQQQQGKPIDVSPLLPPNLSPIKLALNGNAASRDTQYTSRSILKALQSGVCLKQFVSMQLFNGETTYVDPQGRQWIELEKLPWLKELQRLVWHEGEVAEVLVRMRGTHVLFTRSQLEMACVTVRKSVLQQYNLHL
ncbi:hypothetical protein Ndes2437A_g00949 [Nannochloris sp. 'desiccata']